MDEEKASAVDWTKFDRVFAIEILASILFKLKTGDELKQVEKDYLIEAITKILRKVPSDRALGLKGGKGRRSTALSDRNVNIYNRVIALIDEGNSKRRAFLKVSRELADGKLTDTPKGDLSQAAIEKIYAAINVKLGCPTES